MLRTVRAKFLGVAAFFVVWLVVATGFPSFNRLISMAISRRCRGSVTPVKDALSDVRAVSLEQIALIDRYMRVSNRRPDTPLLSGSN